MHLFISTIVFYNTTATQITCFIKYYTMWKWTKSWSCDSGGKFDRCDSKV